MIFNENYTVLSRDRNQSWFLREMCRNLKDYLLSLSFDESYNNVLYHVGDIFNGETSEILAQELPFLEIRCIDEWLQKPSYEFEFDERTKFYSNIVKWKGTQESFANDIISPAMVYIDSCKEDYCILEDLKFWLPKMATGSILGGYHLSYRQYETPKKMAQLKKSLIMGLGEYPHKVYLDGSWYRLL